jgi:hypothetical protein
VSEENAAARAAKEREIATAQVTTQAKQQLVSLQEQKQLALAVGGAEQMRVQYNITLNKLMREGVDAITAQKVAAQERENAQIAANKSVEDQTRSLNQQTELMKARQTGDEASVAAAQAYTNAIRQGADATAAAALSAATLRNYVEKAAEEAVKLDVALEAASTSSGTFAQVSTTTAQGALGTSHGGTTIGPSINMGSIDWNKIDPLHTLGPNMGNLNFAQAQKIAGVAATMPLGQLSYSPGQLQGYYSQEYSQYNLATLQKLYAQSPVYRDVNTPQGAALHDALQKLGVNLDSNTSATQANTAATMGLSGIYSGGHQAIGYYNYGSGGATDIGYAGPPVGSTAPAPTITSTQPSTLSRFVQSNNPALEQTPYKYYQAGGTIPAYGLGYVGEHGPTPRFIRAGGEAVHVSPGEPGNDNSRPPITVVQNFSFSGEAAFERRRSVRQFAEGAGRGLAAVS